MRDRIDLGQSLADAITYIDTALDRKGLTAFDAREPEERHQAVAATLRMSLDQLAVCPEGADIPLTTTELLWGLDDFDTEDLCGRLFGLSLLWSLDLATRRLRLHDVLRSYLCDQHKDRLPELHARVIEAYRVRCPDGWHSGPNDGYFFRYLPRHLWGAGQAEELQKLLFDYRWLRAKLEAVGLAGLILDFEQLGTDEQARKLAAGLRLSAHALAGDPRQVSSQLLGRFAAGDGPQIADLLTDARNRADRPGLLPVRPSLTPPGTALIRILADYSWGGFLRWLRCLSADRRSQPATMAQCAYGTWTAARRSSVSRAIAVGSWR